jgi:hypothetical protein
VLLCIYHTLLLDPYNTVLLCPRNTGLRCLGNTVRFFPVHTDIILCCCACASSRPRHAFHKHK